MAVSSTSRIERLTALFLELDPPAHDQRNGILRLPDDGSGDDLPESMRRRTQSLHDDPDLETRETINTEGI